MSYWVDYARGKRVDRVVFASARRGGAWNRTAPEVEQRILSVRRLLREESVLGEFGADAIGFALQEDPSIEQVPSRATIHRVLARRERSMLTTGGEGPPPKGWYLPALAQGAAELDSFDFIEDLKSRVDRCLGAHRHERAWGPGGRLDHGAERRKAHARSPVGTLATRGVAHLRAVRQRHDLPGGTSFVDTVGRISRLCLALEIIPVFARRASLGSRTRLKALTPFGRQGLATPLLSRCRKPRSRLAAVYRRLSCQNRPATRKCSSPPPVSQAFPTRPRRPAPGDPDLPAAQRR